MTQVFLTRSVAWRFVATVLLGGTLTGCAALRPIDGMPVSQVPFEWKAQSRDSMRTIDLSLLRRTRPEVHIVDSGDVLAIHIGGVFISPDKEELPPVSFPENGEIPPSTGFPVPVRDDGTISVPIVGAIMVRGMSVRQVEDLLRRKYVDEEGILKKGKEKITVNLQRPRRFRVLVIRQESSGSAGGAGPQAGGASGGGGLSGGGSGQGSGSVSIGGSKRGTGRVVSLPIYENDVLHALAESSGLPGLDAENAVYVIRGNRGCQRLMNNSPQSGWNQPVADPMSQQSAQPWQSMDYPNGNGEYTNPLPMENEPESGTDKPKAADENGEEAMLLPGVQLQVRGQSPEPVRSGFFSRNFGRSKTVLAGGNPVPAAVGRHGIVQAGFKPNPYAPFGAVSAPQHSIGNIADQPLPLPVETFQSSPSIPMQNPGAVNPASPYVNMPNTTIPQNNASVSGMPMPQASMSGMPIPQASIPGVSMPMPQHELAPAPPAHNQFNGFDGQNAYNGPVTMQGFGMFGQGYTIQDSGVIRIPVRLKPGEVPRFSCDDITLKNGDIIFIESRDSEVYYTGGLLGGGQYTLPRDYDVDVIEAISLAQGGGQNQQPNLRNVGGISSLNQDVSISASEAIILRKLPGGQQARIKVDLYRAVRYPSERILIQPGDFIMLQFTRRERFWAFLERHLLEGALIGVATSTLTGN